MREEFPEAFLSVSSEVLPQYREYEGFSTVCLNAYVGPKVSRYVRGLAGAMEHHGFAGDLHLMTSAGGVMTAASAAEKPVSTLFSGPVAGLMGGIWVGRTAGTPSVISLDVGGTSADIGIVMGAAGSDAALETADVALMADELLKIPYALRLSRATVRNIKANLAISLTLKAAFVAAAIVGVATLWMAVLADTGASVIVIANALRLLRAD